MRLRTRLVLFIALAALLPLSALGVVATHVSTTQLLDKATEQQARTASSLAELTDAWVALQLSLLARQASTFDLGRLDDATRVGFLRALYLQTPGAQAVALVDDAGVDLAPSVYLRTAGRGELEGRDAIDDERFARFRDELDRVRRATPPGRVSFGPPYLPAGRAIPVMVLVARLADGTALALELDLAPLADRFGGLSGAAERLALLDEAGRPVLGDVALVDQQAIAALPAGALVDDMRYELADGTQVLAASAAVAETGWRVVVAEPTASTLGPARSITARTAFVAGWAALFSVVLGALIGRQLTGPVLALRDAALRVAEGDYGRRVEGVERAGELTDLAHTFNFMSRKLEQDRDLIAAKNAEIEAFNRELQDRVEQRTRELREAQDQLVRTARLAAVGEMGAGLAHELNNPLAGILGMAQVLAARAAPETSQHRMLASIEEEARRCTRIVAQLQRFAETERDAGAVDPAAVAVVDLTAVLEEVLGLVRGSFQDRGVSLSLSLQPALRVQGERGALAQAMVQLLTSLRAAAPPGASLHVHGHHDGAEVLLDLSVRGGALRVGQDDWMASGMGLWAARRVLATHGGTLDEPELPRDGTATAGTWQIRLPRA